MLEILQILALLNLLLCHPGGGRRDSRTQNNSPIYKLNKPRHSLFKNSATVLQHHWLLAGAKQESKEAVGISDE